MPRGKRRSEESKALAGTLENTRRIDLAPSDLSTRPNTAPTFPEPPSTLDEYGRKVYWQLVQHVHHVDALWNIDVLVVSNAAYWAQVHYNHQVILSENGEFVQTFQNGTRQISPEMSVLNFAEKHMQNYFDLLGVGPKSREGIAAFSGSGSAKKEDPYSNLLSRLNADPAEVV